jgi:glycolate dehydrogenase FAD-binding subunit
VAEFHSDHPMDDLIRPGSDLELSDIVRESARKRQSLKIRAGRTHESFSNVGPDPDSTIDLTGLDSVIEYSPVDLTVAVGAGVHIGTIDRLLADHSQRLALDMPNRDMATIGGSFATGLSGPRRLRYGSLKDAIIGAEIVNARGEITKTGGMVVKNVSGYEVARLHYGAHGAFGVVSRLNLKVLPAVESRVEVVLAYLGADDALAIGCDALVSRLDAAAVYIRKSHDGNWDLHLQFEGSEGFTSAQADRAADRFSTELPPVSLAMVRLVGASTPAFDAVADLCNTNSSVSRLSVPASKQLPILKELGEIEGIDILADLGSGLVYVRSDDATMLRTRLFSLSAPIAFLALPESQKRDLDIFGTMDQNAAVIVQRLKDEFDPERIFNPGRFVAFL